MVIYRDLIKSDLASQEVNCLVKLLQSRSCLHFKPFTSQWNLTQFSRHNTFLVTSYFMPVATSQFLQTGLEWHCRDAESGTKFTLCSNSPRRPFVGQCGYTSTALQATTQRNDRSSWFKEWAWWELHIICTARGHFGVPDFVICELLIRWLISWFIFPCFHQLPIVFFHTTTWFCIWPLF